MLAGRLPPRSASGSAWEGVRQSLSPGAEAALPGGRRGRSPLPSSPRARAEQKPSSFSSALAEGTRTSPTLGLAATGCSGQRDSAGGPAVMPGGEADISVTR